MDSSVRGIGRRAWLAASGTGALAAGRRRYLRPGDESGSDPAFRPFLAALRQVVKSRDEARLRALCAPDVITGIDMKPGPEELVKRMRDGGWARLAAVLEMGAGRYEKGLAMPYLFAKFPDDLESFEHVVTIQPKAVLRAEPKAGAAVVCELDYDILSVKDARPQGGWLRAARLDGPAGWVAESDVRSLGAERIFFEKRAGTWKIAAWAGGD